MDVTFFSTPGVLRRWFGSHHRKAAELWIGFHKKASGRPSVTYQEALDEALCFGWIDGVRKSIDDASYTIRFTPRKAKSNWSRINVARVEQLHASGRLQPAGLEAFEKRASTSAYSYENALRDLDAPLEKRLKANGASWAFWTAQPPGYRRVASWWVMSAKKEETRQRRLAVLIDCSERGERLPPLAGPASK
jgi:uncharacterized protein YdeI (YjbR/CyaY-like superfamily)